MIAGRRRVQRSREAGPIQPKSITDTFARERPILEDRDTHEVACGRAEHVPGTGRIDTRRTSIVSMIRLRSANNSDALDIAAFTTTPRILTDSLREIEASAKAGAHSVAIGLLTADGQVDVEACATMRDVALTHGMSVAFLRTFDLLVDRQRGMDDITALGITRVLTAAVAGWDASVRMWNTSNWSCMQVRVECILFSFVVLLFFVIRRLRRNVRIH